jgi:hypothetical protein
MIVNSILTAEQSEHSSWLGTRAPVVLLELNELSPTLMNRFIDDGELPNFKRLRDSSQVYVSDAEEIAPNLEPWIQWVTVHSGLPYNEHRVFHLGDGHKLKVKSLWDLVSERGRRVWVCGSMNVKYERPINGVILPDPWSSDTTPYPDDLMSFFRFVQHAVQEHTNERAHISKSDAARFLKFLATHGLTFHTARSLVLQLLSERCTGKGRWKRATILDKMQRDIFLHYFRKQRPDFSTFFLNSTAHFQHMYWRNMDPEPFKLKPTNQEQSEYRDAILYGYREMDRIVVDIMDAAPKDAVLILATALSQQPCLVYEDSGGKKFYRPWTFDRLLEFVGVESWSFLEPVMSEQFHIHFATKTEATRAAELLASLRVEGKQVMAVEIKSSVVFAGCQIFEQLGSHEVQLEGGAGGRSTPFFQIFYQVDGTKSGMHHPDGILWIRIPGRPAATHASRVPLRDIPPTILAILGIDKPPYMSGVVLEGAKPTPALGRR